MSVNFHVTIFKWHNIKVRWIYKLEKCSAPQKGFNVIDTSIISLNVIITPCVRSYQGWTNYISYQIASLKSIKSSCCRPGWLTSGNGWPGWGWRRRPLPGETLLSIKKFLLLKLSSLKLYNLRYYWLVFVFLSLGLFS